MIYKKIWKSVIAMKSPIVVYIVHGITETRKH